jgi:soluble P-type ATPase
MKDPNIEKLVKQLHSSVSSVNVIMEKLQDLNVDVKISYNDSRSSGIDENGTQSIKVWRIEERNDYL